jgi:demethylmenaquinone methyltransferase/2-methoxy-6-polyprenyl-1,4-benzoquinol methylase
VAQAPDEATVASREALVKATTRDPNEFAQELFDGLSRRYDMLAEVLSFAQNGRWRDEMVRHVEDRRPTSILDVATGTAGVALELAGRTQARVTGLDLTHPMLRQGQERVERAGATDRVRLVVGQAERLPFPDATFDALTFTYLLRYVADPAATLRELVRVIRPGGSIASLEFAVPGNPFWRACWWLYTRLVLPAAGYVTGGREWYDVGRFLGPNISAHYRRYPVSWTVHAWTEAGLADVKVRSMSLGGGLVMWARKPDA